MRIRLLALLPAIFPASALCTPVTPIAHVIVIMQENRSFDDYFGTFPGANGIPQGTCVPINPSTPAQGCVAPYHDPRDVQGGGPHSAINAQADIDDGITQAKMDGFVHEQKIAKCTGSTCSESMKPLVAGSSLPFAYDVMGYHTAEEIPNYWAYAKTFVLQDNMFESVRSWSLMAHLYLTSEWAASCEKAVLSTCVTSPDVAVPKANVTSYPWVNLFQLLDIKKVSWKYYLGEGDEPDCDDDEMTCAPEPQASTVPGIWNPAPFFSWVQAQGSAYLAQHNPSADKFLIDVKNGTLPQVSWVVPAKQYSEHPSAGTTEGMDYVTAMVNAVMQSPYWNNTAIFITWDDWGGFYDHVAPPIIDRNSTATPIQGYGLRVPGLVISAYAKKGHIDHQLLSFDSYATFIEYLFMNNARLNPVVMNQPDARPTVRDAIRTVTLIDGSTTRVGNLLNDFDFSSPPSAPLILNTHIPAQLKLECNKFAANTINCPKGFATLKITWSQFTGADTSNSFTYYVQRDGVTLPQCTGSLVTCTDTPPMGYHYYRAYSVDKSGVTSPTSPAAFAHVAGD